VAALLGASVTPLLLTLASRFPLGAGPARRNVVIQLAACLAIAAGLIVVSCFLAAWLLDHRAAPTGAQLTGQLFANLLLLVLCLSLLLGAIQAAPALFEPKRSPHWPEQITLSERGRAVVVPVASIERIETQGNYQALHTEGGVHLYRSTSAALEARLDPARFVRIHRRHIVSLAAIERIEPLPSGDAVIVMRSGARLRQARQYRSILRERLAG
jgi:DNA-binding LytR/AlgR family response regulator